MRSRVTFTRPRLSSLLDKPDWVLLHDCGHHGGEVPGCPVSLLHPEAQHQGPAVHRPGHALRGSLQHPEVLRVHRCRESLPGGSGQRDQVTYGKIYFENH